MSTQSENSISLHAVADLNRRTETAACSIRSQLVSQRDSAGYWTGELSGSALSTATAISALSFFLQQPDADGSDDSDRANATQLRNQAGNQIDTGIRWLSENQNQDGGWGDTDLSYSNISTTMLVVAAFHAAQRADRFSESIERAQRYIDSQGGVPALRRRYGKDKTFAVPILANCAMAGIVAWEEVAAFPFEAACVPQRFYHLMQMPVVSYAVPALVAIGQAKFVNDPPRNPLTRMIRKLSVRRSLRVLDRMQPASGGFLEAIPLTSFVVMALINAAQGEHDVVRNGVRFILESFRDEGTWPIDTNLATWNTTLSINALSQFPKGLHPVELENSTEPAAKPTTDSWNGTLDWLLDCQYKTVHPFTGSPPGGWGWSDLSGSVPDADDTPGALLALANLNHQIEFDDSRKKKIVNAAGDGVQWLLDLQNRDRGWPTFCRGWGRFPFDRSGADITAHALRALIAWKSCGKGRFTEQKFQSRIDRAIERGFHFLNVQQCDDGSWTPLWFGNQDYQDDLNPCYGTAKVLLAYRDARRFDTQAAQKGLNWIAANQNADGGWGGGKSLDRPKTPITVPLGTSSVEESSLCLETLVYSNLPEHRENVSRATEWLVAVVENDLAKQCWPIGFYFAKLWYYEALYPLIFATSSLGAVTAMGSTGLDEPND